jgi:hypothetical protein
VQEEVSGKLFKSMVRKTEVSGRDFLVENDLQELS